MYGRRIITKDLFLVVLCIAPIVLVSGSIGAFALPPENDESIDDIISVEPEISIEFKEDLVMASTDPFSDRISNVEGVVTCILPDTRPSNNVYCLVYLTSIIEDWPCSTSSALSFSNVVSTQNFQVVFRAETGLKAWEELQLTVYARWRLSPGMTGGDVPPENVTVRIAPFSNIKFVNNLQNLSLEVGKEGDFQLEVVNEGNAPTDVKVKMEIPNGSLELSLENTSLKMRPNEHRTILGRARQTTGEPEIWSITFTAQGSTQGMRNVTRSELKVFTRKPPLIDKKDIRTGIVLLALSVLIVIAILLVNYIIHLKRKHDQRMG